ncbi:hypothetical protein TPLL2_0126b [Treponema paraluiscuniculi]|uniref:Major outer sheath protein C-terminal domain-containing protein n=1 Tax=Treponema paraluiscuniculi TaxID=53435 RepID=A0ABY9E3L4_9SPIR|nr:hypothetical protein TPLL2_0126b [Treponema paraluiscuniculi]
MFGWERTREDGGTEYIKVELTGNSTLSGDYARPRAPDILWDVGAKVSMKLWGMCALVATDVGHKRDASAPAPAADALLTLGYRWFSAGGYFASQASNVFGGVFLTNNMQKDDCATYIKLETKSGDPYTHLLTGLNAGVEARVYMPVHWNALAAAPPGAPDKILDFYSPAHESPVSHHRARIFGGVFLTNNMLQHDCAVRRGA